MKTQMLLAAMLSVVALGATALDTENSMQTDNQEATRSATIGVDDQAAQAASKTLKEDALRRSTIAKVLAPIRSQGDLDQHIATHRAGTSPFDALQPSLRQMFLASLTFNEKGVTGFRYDVLETLSATEVYNILSLFGMQGSTSQIKRARVVTPTDALIMSPAAGGIVGGIGLDFLEDYRCQSKGTCTANNMKACTSNC